jgi:alanine dehydrogenase
MSKIAGKLAVQIAGRLLETSEYGGRGILLGGLPGIPPAEVAVIGGGTLGSYAARSFCGAGANVSVVDKDPARLEEIERYADGKVVTILYNQQNLRKVCRFADVLVCSVRAPLSRTPLLVTREMVKGMKKGTVILEFSIPEGGCVETARLTPQEDYVYVEEGVIHFCVPNVPTFVARTATYALTNALLPYLQMVAEKGVEETLRVCQDLQRGVRTFNGFLTSETARSGKLPYAELGSLLGGK